MCSTGSEAEERASAFVSMLTEGVSGLLEMDLSGLSDTAVVETMRSFETQLRRGGAISHRLIIDSHERALPASLGFNSVTKVLIEVLRLSTADASARVRAAKTLGTWHTLTGHDLPATLPSTAAAQRDGQIGPDHARAVERVYRKIPRTVSNADHVVAEEILAELARTGTPEDVQHAGERLLAYLNPNGKFTDEVDRARRRGVRIGRQDSDLMTPISGDLDPTTRALLDPILAKWARPGMNNPDDPDSPTGEGTNSTVDADTLAAAAGRDKRTAAQRNHDAFTALFRTMLESGSLGSHRGLPATTIITMTLEQLEQASGVVTTASGGLVPIKDALKLADTSHPVLVLFDHDGRPLHLGRTKRLASTDQRLALIATEGGCTRPGCSAPATRTAVHHLTEWANGGCTDIDDLGLACDPCHALVNDGPGGWKTVKVPTGSEFAGRTAWIAPEHIDPTRTPRVNHRHRPQELLDHARKRAQVKRDAETRERQRRSSKEPPTTDDEIP